MGCCSKLLNNPRTEKEAMESSLCYCFWMNHNALGSSIGGIVLQKLIYCPVSHWFSVLFSAIHSDEIQRNKTTFNDIGQLCIHTDEYVSNQRALFTWSDPCTERHISWVSPINAGSLVLCKRRPLAGSPLVGYPAGQQCSETLSCAVLLHHATTHRLTITMTKKILERIKLLLLTRHSAQCAEPQRRLVVRNSRETREWHHETKCKYHSNCSWDKVKIKESKSIVNTSWAAFFRWRQMGQVRWRVNVIYVFWTIFKWEWGKNP